MNEEWDKKSTVRRNTFTFEKQSCTLTGNTIHLQLDLFPVSIGFIMQ